MAVEMRKDIREVTLEEGKYVLSATQEQVYDKENVEAMLRDWNKKLTDYQEWLDKFDSHVEDGMKMLLQQLTLQKEKIEAEVASLKEGIALWSDVRSKD